MTSNSDAAFDAAEKIDSLLSADDGTILASIAYYKSSLLEMFGRDGLVEMLRMAVDEAPDVDYFSRRSRREIDPGRPEVNLRVNDAGALEAMPDLKQLAGRFGGRVEDLDSNESKQHDVLVSIKSGVIFEQVCRPMASLMNEALGPHWQKARSRLISRGLDPDLARMLLTNIFTIRVSRDAKVTPRDRMCTLGLFL